MNFWRKITDLVRGNEDFPELKFSSIRYILNGSILNKGFIRKQYKLILLIAFLAFFYIDNRYYCEKQLAREVQLKKELQDIKFESLTISAQLTTLGRRTHILNYIETKGLSLKESANPPIVIEEPNKKKQTAALKAKEAHKQATERIKKDTTQNEEIIEQ